MEPTFEADITLLPGIKLQGSYEIDEQSHVDGQIMYVIVWVGKALSGHEVLVRGEDIEAIEVNPIVH